MCDFCRKSQRQVKKIIQGPEISGTDKNAEICDECVELCLEIFMEDGHEFADVRVAPKDVIELMSFRPVFQRRIFAQRPSHCFYLGPFREPFNTIYAEQIVPALLGEGVTTQRGDEIYSADVVIEDVWEGINTAHFLVADVTGKNPNVMYEIGMAHTVGKPVLIISQSLDDIPFDLRHRRCVIYDYTPPGCRALTGELARTARYILART